MNRVGPQERLMEGLAAGKELRGRTERWEERL